jgi:hypothetical protein
MFMNDDNRYRAYLIRFQRGKDHSHWYVEMQNAHTGERHRFVTEQALFRYLEQSLMTNPPDRDSSE